MSNVIRFLESMGSDARIARLSYAEYERTVMGLGLAEKEILPLLGKDVIQLRGALDAIMPMYCLIAAPSDQEGEKAPEKENDDDAPNQNEPPAGS